MAWLLYLGATALAIENRCGSKKNHFGNIGHIGGCNVAFKDYGKLPFAPATFSWLENMVDSRISQKTIAKAMKYHINVRKLPGNGCILNTSHFNGDVIKDAHISAVLQKHC